ncbi:3,4-dihydroxy-2-butanone-4-phosphate synthase [Rhodococcoides fascians]|uniref:3,4-dihydroxy-2-butanone-4-phosphate synthase n=1 Tax=Rhodococcoides fascians TaxID=1828 RepID=UPI00068EDDE4|nr:3,4-dihydroxy-2-butanone-4-phosphate synthase [Rhodococcus fascians]
MSAGFTGVETAVNALQSGRPVLSVDRTGVGAVVLAAENATVKWTAWAVRYSSGLLFAAMPAERADHLDLPPMVPQNNHTSGHRFTVAVDARRGVTTGISAADRAHTFRTLSDSSTTPDDLTRPGHVVPLCTDLRGVLGRAASPELAVDLCAAAGLSRVAAVATLVSDAGDVLNESGVADLAAECGLDCVRLEEMVLYRHHQAQTTRTQCVVGA